MTQQKNFIEIQGMCKLNKILFVQFVFYTIINNKFNSGQFYSIGKVIEVIALSIWKINCSNVIDLCQVVL